MSNLWDASRGTIDRGYGHLPFFMVHAWAEKQSELSDFYRRGLVEASSKGATTYIRKRDMLERVREALVSRSSLTADEIDTRLTQTSNYLEDPGLLENFEYFDIPSSDFMLQFYFAVWDRRIAEVMCYLHNYGKDLHGIPQRVPEGDVWYQMSYFEGMNINERKKAQDVVDFIRAHDIVSATSFGGGNVPERLYGLPEDLKLTIFDDGPVSSLKELFPNPHQRRNVTYYHERLSQAAFHAELEDTQGLVWMHGVSMYLDEKQRQMTGAILCGTKLLQPGGFMKYDYLVWTDSMRRVINTQCWPYDPNNPMTIFDNADEAINQGRTTLSVVNSKLAGKTYMDAMDPVVTLVEPWGVTSVRFTVQKHA